MHVSKSDTSLGSLCSAADIYHKASEILSQRKRFAIASVIKAKGSTPRSIGAKMIILEDGTALGTIGGGCLESYIYTEVKKVFTDGTPRIVEADLGDDSWSGVGMACGGKVEIMIELVEPSPYTVILGSGHLAKAIAEQARLLGYKLVVIDPLARPEDFPHAEKVIKDGYREALPGINIKPFDKVVIVTKHHSDEEALRAALSTAAGYIGMVGSRNRVKMTYDTLLKNGVPEEKLLRVHAPIGLDIGAETVEEIAVSIFSEIIMNQRGGTGQPKSVKKIGRTEPAVMS